MDTFNTLRAQDIQSEKAISQFLDRHFYPKHFSSFKRYEDKETQLLGIDVIANSAEGPIKIDEKAASHYVNKDIQTFAFELSYIGKNNQLRKGWFYDKEKHTEYYLLCWLWASQDKFKYEDLTKVEVALINRQKLIDLLDNLRLNYKRARAIDNKLRQANITKLIVEGKPFYFYHTKHLAEKPTNLIIPKKLLIELSDSHHIIGNTPGKNS